MRVGWATCDHADIPRRRSPRWGPLKTLEPRIYHPMTPKRRILLLTLSLVVLGLGFGIPAPTAASPDGGCPAVRCYSTYKCQQLSPWCNICDRKPIRPVCD